MQSSEKYLSETIFEKCMESMISIYDLKMAVLSQAVIGRRFDITKCHDCYGGIN